MKKLYNEQQFNNLLKNLIKESLKRKLNEYFVPMEGFDDFSDNLDFGAHDIEGEDDYENELVRSMDKKNKKALGIDDNNSSGNFIKDVRGLDKRVSNKETEEFDDEVWGDTSDESDIETNPENIGEYNDELYVKALEDIENDNGRTKMEVWVQERVEEGTDEKEAEEAFKAAKAEYDKENGEYETDYISSFNKRQEPEVEHQAGNVIEYDGVQIKDDGTQYVMVAKTNDPEITIKGSNLSEVEKTYDKLWNDMGSMEERARKMGMTVWNKAMLWDNDYDTFVRAAGAHEEGLPIVIDLDKLKNRYNKTGSRMQHSSENSWLEPYKHEINNKYMMTPYQISRLTPEQRSEWERLTKMNPSQYVTYSEAPSLGKINRYKNKE